MLIIALENEMLVHDYCAHTLYKCPKERMVSQKGRLLHLPLALWFGFIPSQVLHADMVNFKLSSRLQTWPWNARINPLKERLGRAVWQFFSAAPPQYLHVW